MSNSADTSYGEYKNLMQWPSTLDIPLLSSEDELVNIDFKQKESLLDNPEDFTQLLIEENCNKSYWLTIAINYVKAGKIKQGIKLIELALNEFQGPESAHLHTFLAWAFLDLSKATFENADNSHKTEYLKKAEFHLQKSIQFEPIWIGNMLATIDVFYQKGEYDKALETLQLFTKAITSNSNQQQSSKNVFFSLMKAKLLYQKKNYLGSLKIFQELIIMNPVLIPDPRIGCGLCYWQLGDFEMALNAWERSLELNPDNFDVKILLLLSKYHATINKSLNDDQFVRNYTSTINDLKKVYAMNKFIVKEQRDRTIEVPEFTHVEEINPSVLILLQMYYFFSEQYETCIEIYEKKFDSKLELQVSKEIASISLFWAGRSFFAMKNLKQALKYFQKSLSFDEMNGLSLFGLGQLEYCDNFLDEAILTFQNFNEKIDKHSIEGNYVLGCLNATKLINVLALNERSSDTVIGQYLQTDSIRAKSIEYLETYIKLVDINKKSQMVSLKAYIILSQLYEQKNMFEKCVYYYQKIIDQLKFLKSEVNWDIFNNLACYQYGVGKYEDALANFKLALEKFDQDAQKVDDKIRYTIEYNIIRTEENVKKDEDKSIILEKYNELLSRVPENINLYVQLRKCLLDDKSSDLFKKISEENKYNLEVRSIYSWMIKADSGSSIDDEIIHNNDYKLKNSYLKALKLFRNALNLDPYNVYAAQGIAIVYAGLGKHTEALQILRRCRDSINDKSVFINLAQELTAIHDYIKAIDNYNIALSKTKDLIGKADVLNMLGRVWLLRYYKDGSIDFIYKAVECNQKAIDHVEQEVGVNTKDHLFEKFMMDLKFNQISLYMILVTKVVKIPQSQRSLEKMENVLINVQDIIQFIGYVLNSKDLIVFFHPKDLSHKYNKLKGELVESLTEAIEDQKNHDMLLEKRLKEAKEYAEQEKLQETKEREEQELKEQDQKRIELEKYTKLQEEAQKIIDERQEMIDDENDIVDDENKDKDAEFVVKDTKKASKKRKANVVVEDDEDLEELTNGNESFTSLPRSKRGKTSNLTPDYIEDSDEEPEKSEAPDAILEDAEPTPEAEDEQ
ncbi:unnamed protein product [Hanseniaspora opuntiae]